MSNEDAIKKAMDEGVAAEDIAADLADDGVLNNSHITGILATKENTSAIEKATEAAKATHKLLTALIPILILVAGSGLELGGIIDLTPAGDGEDEWLWEDTEYWGCMDYESVNYDEYATHDDGSCDFPRYGCTDPEADNYEAVANEDDGSCEYYEPIYGCTDDEATNYNTEADEDDGSCEYPPCEPFFYDYYMDYINESKTGFIFGGDVDLDCDETQEVQVQFLAYKNESVGGDSPQDYGILNYNVTNGDYGYENITLADLPDDYYDLYAYLINDDGEIQKELTWFNIQIRRD
tara:strand:- start:13085 stop:13963 length:879 start_codon:yes stop_codon:yes gene_type:complete